METKNIKISGVHGVGKTTVMNVLIEEIYKDNMFAKIASYSEFRHKPPHKIGSPLFQRIPTGVQYSHVQPFGGNGKSPKK